jgi:cobalamin biosynthesis protein CbiD
MILETSQLLGVGDDTDLEYVGRDPKTCQTILATGKQLLGLEDTLLDAAFNSFETSEALQQISTVLGQIIKNNIPRTIPLTANATLQRCDKTKIDCWRMSVSGSHSGIMVNAPFLSLKATGFGRVFSN